MLAALAAALLLSQTSQPIPVKFPRPERIRYDGQCFTINGKDTIVYSGAFHYFRCPKELWADRFKKIKDAGFNTVESYVAWNAHEIEMPKDLDDFSHVDLKDLTDWLKMATDKFGLNVIIRPGPYICAEWDNGGYPHWLSVKRPEAAKGMWLRGDDPGYLAWCDHWYKSACKAIAPWQITNRGGKPGVILFQVENEYDYAGGSDTVHENQVRALTEDAWKYGIDVPILSCWTRQVRGSQDPVLSQIMDSCNFYPRWDIEGTRGSLQQVHRQQPNKPVMVTELQGGWFSEIGGLLAEDQGGITPAQIRNLTLYCWANGLTSSSYYMLFGGTNFAERTPPNITTSYDYNAPIRESGGIDGKYYAVKGLGAFIQAHGSELARTEPIDIKTQGNDPEVDIIGRKSSNGAIFAFIRNKNHADRKKGSVTILEGRTINYDLQAFDANVFYYAPGSTVGELAAPSALPMALIPVPDPVSIPEAITWTDDGGKAWEPTTLGQDLLANGIGDNRYVIFRSHYDAIPGSTTLWVKPMSSGAFVVQLNDNVLLPSGKVGSASLFDVSTQKPTGNDIRVLFENPGNPNGGAAMEAKKGIAEIYLVPKTTGDIVVTEWRVKRASGASDTGAIGTNVDDQAWETGNPSWINDNDAYGTYRAKVNLTADDIKSGTTRLVFDCIDDDGWVYVNGIKVGEAHDWSAQQSFDASKALHDGENVVAVLLHNNNGEGGITQPARFTKSASQGKSLTWEISKAFATNPIDPKPIALQGTPKRKHDPKAIAELPTAEPDALARWYGFHFATPATDGAKVRWRLLLDASGNGMIYINGHHLGRYWEIGPQREFYVPETWLKADNEVKIMLRPTDHGALLRSAQFAPYPNYAER